MNSNLQQLKNEAPGEIPFVLEKDSGGISNKIRMMDRLVNSLPTARVQGSAQLEALTSFKISSADVNALGEIAPFLDPYLPMIADAYIEHLERFTVKGKFFSLREAVIVNLRHIISGNFEVHDTTNGWSLGHAFAEAGVPLAALSSASNIYCEKVYPLILLCFQRNQSQLIGTLIAFQRVVQWDQAMIRDAYRNHLRVESSREVSLGLRRLIGRLAEGAMQIEIIGDGRELPVAASAR